LSSLTGHPEITGTLADLIRAAAGSGEGTLRDKARGLGRNAALNLDAHWQSAPSTGPVDVIDVFSGCGGMSAGFHAFNGAASAYRLALAIDVDPIANETYARNLPIAPTPADVHELAARPAAFEKMVANARQSPDHPLVLIGCAPCQGFSSHRNGEGASDSRNSLFGEFASLATAIEPDALVVENVPELLTDRYWPLAETAAEIMREAGYEVYIGVHNMAEFGVPQERFRAVMLAMRKRFLPLHGFLSRERFKTVKAAIGGLSEISPGDPDAADPMHYTARHRASTVAVIDAVPKDGGNRPPGIGPKCLDRMAVTQGKAGYEDVYGRLAWDRPAVTITNYARNPASGRFSHPEQSRGLSVREAALLQGFPGGYWFAGSLDPSFRQIGNAVPPIFSSFLAGFVLGELMGEEPEAQEAGMTAPVGPSFSRLIPALKAGNRQLSAV
jgi:DNA (cytosine-5)-methyltransferase 1